MTEYAVKNENMVISTDTASIGGNVNTLTRVFDFFAQTVTSEMPFTQRQPAYLTIVKPAGFFTKEITSVVRPADIQGTILKVESFSDFKDPFEIAKARAVLYKPR